MVGVNATARTTVKKYDGNSCFIATPFNVQLMDVIDTETVCRIRFDFRLEDHAEHLGQINDQNCTLILPENIVEASLLSIDEIRAYARAL